MKLQKLVESAITEATGEKARIEDFLVVTGGSINDSRVVLLADGRRYFVKTHPSASSFPGMFAAEFEALHMLSDAGMIRVPGPVAYAENFIVLEAFREGTPKPDWHELIGSQLASLHMKTVNDRFGFEYDNYLGTTQQPNNWTHDWLGFWRDQRIGWQLNLFSKKTEVDDRLLRLGDKLLARLEEFIGYIEEPSVLLHGDLWSGNASADETGDPIIFDPASYYGHREAEIGMMRLFGGFGPRCEAAYNEVWPFEPGAEERITLYRLYHELNHLNLFGRSYYQGCISTIEALI